jgi:hypothetical protein
VELEAVAAALAPRLIAYALARTGCRATVDDLDQDVLPAPIVGPPPHAGAGNYIIVIPQ